MPDPPLARQRRIRWQRVLAVISLPPLAWLAFKGLDTNNLSPTADIWLGAVFGLAAFRWRTLRFLIAVSSALLILGASEIVAYCYEEKILSPPKIYSYAGEPSLGFMSEHPLVGYAFRGPAQLWASATIGDEILFDSVQYSIDSLSRRTCVAGFLPPQHALVFGGSFAFGEGLSNSEMIACQLETASGNRYQGYNYGMMGWGASQAYNQLGVDDLFSDIRQPSGVAVFCFIGDHIHRTTWNIGTAATYPEYPFFQMSDSGELVGPFKTRDRWNLEMAASAYSFWRGYSPLFRTLGKPALFRIESDIEAVRTTAHVLAATRLRYRQRFDGEFIVLIWPRARLDRALEDRFVDELGVLGVPVVMAAKLPGDALQARLHRNDPHPSAKEIAWVTLALLGEMRILEGAAAGP